MARRTEYLLADGTRSSSRADAQVVEAGQVVASALKFSSLIAPQFFVGTAQHETNFAVNEEDTEESGYVSTGIYQLSRGEAVSVGLPLASLVDLDDSSQVFASLCEARFRAIALAAGFDTSAPPADAWAYLAIAHNQGLTAALKTINQYGLDWAGYKARNPSVRIVSSGYGDDVISGGASWSPDLVAASGVQPGSGSSGLLTRAVIAVLLVGLFYRVL